MQKFYVFHKTRQSLESPVQAYVRLLWGDEVLRLRVRAYLARKPTSARAKFDNPTLELLIEKFDGEQVLECASLHLRALSCACLHRLDCATVHRRRAVRRCGDAA